MSLLHLRVEVRRKRGRGSGRHGRHEAGVWRALHVGTHRRSLAVNCPRAAVPGSKHGMLVAALEVVGARDRPHSGGPVERRHSELFRVPLLLRQLLLNHDRVEVTFNLGVRDNGPIALRD
jgi:hypothetical protein